MASGVNDRELILEILLMITKEGEYSHIALRQVLDQYQYLDKKERSFITRVVNGTLERMIEIDYILNQFSKVKVNKMKPVIRTIMRSSIYQLKYMDAIPPAAVCNEAVKLAGKRGFSQLKGFVNGVLRNISRNLEKVEYPEEDLRNMSVKYSLPTWILEQWIGDYGKEKAELMAEASLETPPLSVRFNEDKIAKKDLMDLLRRENVEVAEVEGLPCALYLSGYDRLTALDSFNKGYYQVQDVSSMQVAYLANPREGAYCIDVCAAPGGKAIHVAELLKGSGRVEARDLTDYKVDLIWDNIERSGLDNIEAKRQDATILSKDSVDKADLVIADLPCSGLGVLARKVDLKYKMTLESQRELEHLQRQILSTVKSYVKPGGTLIYSTCTVNKKENTLNAHWFERENPDFHLELEEQRLQGIHEGDGFYIARFRREG